MVAYVTLDSCSYTMSTYSGTATNNVAPTWYYAGNTVDYGTSNTIPCTTTNSSFGTCYEIHPSDSMGYTTTYTYPDVFLPYLTPEQLAALEASRLAYEKEQKAIENKRIQIMKKAERLLKERLERTQLRTLRKHGFFDVKSPSCPDRAYRIPESGMIVMFEKGKPVEKLCIHPADYNLPKGDQLLTLKLLAEAEENELLKTANRHKLDHGRIERVPLFV